MLFVTHSLDDHLISIAPIFAALERAYGWVPELSLSRYLCTSKTRLVTEPSGFVTPRSAGPDPFDTKVSAEVQLFPGRRMI